jgi:hypothetical protein
VFFQFPGAFASFFSPISFLWCSHTSYSSILYLPLTSVSVTNALTKLPLTEVEQTMRTFVASMMQLLPDRRFKGLSPLAIDGIMVAKSSTVTAMARNVSRQEMSTWAVANHLCRFLGKRKD